MKYKVAMPVLVFNNIFMRTRAALFLFWRTALRVPRFFITLYPVRCTPCSLPDMLNARKLLMKKKQVSAAALLPCFEKHLQEKSFFRHGERILVACSGGPDSVALFHLLRTLSVKYGWKLGLIHFNHKLRPGAAQRDENFVRMVARKARIPFFRGEGDVRREVRRTKTSIEECARALRYDFFLKISHAKKFQKIVLGHTRDDQAETVLMRILQGTGLRGLLGIREKMKLGRVTLVRPLLVFPKKELLRYLKEQGFPFRSDKTNDSHQFLRNRIRLKLIPGLQRDFNPRVVEALSRIPMIMADESALISELEEEAWKKTFRRKTRFKKELRRSIFLKLSPSLQFRVVERALKSLDRKSGLSFEAWERLRQGFARHYFRCSLPKDIDFSLTPKRITIYKK